jgi:hypothetical protein
MLPLLLFAAGGVAAQQHALTPDGIAEAWTGTRTPKCAPTPATWITPAGSELCVWRRGSATATWDSVEVSGTVERDGRIAHVVWARRMRDSLSAEVLGDSLSSALVPRGLRSHPCASGSRVWLSQDLAVYFFIGGREKPTGTYRVGVHVVDDPNGIPAVACPDLPRFPAPRKRPPARTRIGA